MKRVVSLFAAAALAASLLAGCGQTGESDWEYVQEKGTLVLGLTKIGYSCTSVIIR